MRMPPALLPALWLLALLGFGLMAGFAAASDAFPADRWLTERLQDVDGTAFERAMDWAEELADEPLVIAVWLASAVAVLPLAGRGQALLVLLAMGARLLNGGLKELIERPRPPLEFVQAGDQASSFSFPSGHAQGSLLVYGLLFYLATVYLPNTWLRLPVQAACLWVVLFAGMERVYAGYHWPSDVVGGYYFGALALAVLIAADRVVLAPGRIVTKQPPLRF